MRDVGTGLFLLFIGSVLIWYVVAQHRTGENIIAPFDVVAAKHPALKFPLIWASTIVIGFLGLIPVMGAGAIFMKALGYL
jgi:hypothetical protein